MIGAAACNLRIAFRADASLEIGTGHVMRCLTLANALREQGAECLFVCRPHRGHLMEQVAAAGHHVLALSVPRLSVQPSREGPAHSAWLGANWETDAAETQQALTDEGIDWLVVDHYALDHHWERALRVECHHLMVMDDLADRMHDCDLLLDPSLGRTPADYDGLVVDGTKMLLGPRYALLRPEFAALRAESLARRKTGALRHLLITMGGVDKDNTTERVLDALDAADLSFGSHITVVMGPHSPWLKEVRARARGMQLEANVRVGVKDMASLMRDSDLAIGAAGSTSWERFCLALPTIQLILAENQTECARQFAQIGAVVDIPPVEDFEPKLIHALRSLDEDALRLMSSRAADVCDGLGTARVVQAMLQSDSI